jgi:putative SOS response-associated peptidase YedK
LVAVQVNGRPQTRDVYTYNHRPYSAVSELAWGQTDAYIAVMCGRVIQSSGPLRYAFVDGMNVRDSRVHYYPPRWNAAPSQELLVIRRNHKTGDVSLDPLRWGLIPSWCKDPTGGRKPINAKCETVHQLPTFRDAYRHRRCIVPVDGFFEWKAIKGQRAKQPYAIAMKDGTPFGIAGIWENWKEPASGEWIRTFAVITTDANELVTDIHDRMPHSRAGSLHPLARRRARPTRSDAGVPGRADADVANFDSRQQA